MARRVRWKKVLIGLLIVVVVGGIGAAATVLLTYHEVTKIDRTVPEAVLAEYLRAKLVRKDAIGAQLYSCADPAGLAPVTALRDELDQREREFDVKVQVSWGAMTRVDKGGQSMVTTSLTISGRKDEMVTSKRSETWRFSLVDEDGWRVCGAERIAMLSPAPSASA